jgi:DNA-binding MarR family transcriptional regulator
MKMESKSYTSGAARPRPDTLSPRERRLRELQRNMHILSAVVRRVLEQAPVESLPDSPITAEQLRLLRFVVGRRGAQVGEVATGLGITPASASLALDRLEALEFVERRKDGRDRRNVKVVATPAGRGVVQRVRRIVDTKLSITADRIGARDTKLFTQLAADVTRALMKGEEYFGDVCMQCGTGCSRNCVIHELFGACPFPE